MRGRRGIRVRPQIWPYFCRLISFGLPLPAFGRALFWKPPVFARCAQTQTGLDCARTQGNAEGVTVTRRLPDWLKVIFLLLAIVVMVVVTGVWLEAVHAF